jgi:hypothetical protein
MEFRHLKDIKFAINNGEEKDKQPKLSKHEYQKILKDYLSDKKYPVGCSSKGITQHGIMPGHVFSLLEFRLINIKNEKLDVV